MPNKHRRKLTGLRLPPETLDELDEWCASQRPPVTRTSVLLMLVDDFLGEQRRKGWKPFSARKYEPGGDDDV